MNVISNCERQKRWKYDSNESKITKPKNGESVANLEIKEAILVCFKIVNNNHQQNSGVFYTLIFKKPIG